MKLKTSIELKSIKIKCIKSQLRISINTRNKANNQNQMEKAPHRFNDILGRT